MCHTIMYTYSCGRFAGNQTTICGLESCSGAMSEVQLSEKCGLCPEDSDSDSFSLMPISSHTSLISATTNPVLGMGMVPVPVLSYGAAAGNDGVSSCGCGGGDDDDDDDDDDQE